MNEPLFWNPLPDAAAWLTAQTGRAIDARTLIDLVIKMGKQGDPAPTIINGERQLSWPVDDNYLGRFVT